MNDVLIKVRDAQDAWADGIVAIGSAYDPEEAARQFLEKLYIFGLGEDHILFKPTKAAKAPFRFNKKQTLSYFVRGIVKEDKGFALTPWREVVFHDLNAEHVIKQDCDILVMGSYTFFDFQGGQATVEYTFGYREVAGKLRIFLHHSSLPFEAGLPLGIAFKESAKNQLGMTGYRVSLPGDFKYNTDREISNSYFNYKPAAVSFPRATNQVAMMLRKYKETIDGRAEDKKIPLRIMSGGHQHEGMSSADDALVIRLSELGQITFNEDKSEAWIPAGYKLGTVYQELTFHQKLIPGGGCLNVNVGGLTQGGGWGLYARKYGLTCDNILAAEMVLANGDIVQASRQSHPDLFAAIRGGGGGNFSVVTRFLFRLQPLPRLIFRFNFGWDHDDMEEVILSWLRIQKDFPKELTAFLRLTAMKAERAEGEQRPAFASGYFLGTYDEFKAFHDQFLIKLPNRKTERFGYKKGAKWTYANKIEDLKPKLNGDTRLDPIEALSSAQSVADFFAYDDTLDPEMFIAAGQASSEVFGGDTKDLLAKADEERSSCLVSFPASNCNGPHPHKVSSAFALNLDNETDADTYYQQVAGSVTAYFQASLDGKKVIDPDHYHQYVRCYMTFHAMGGEISEVPEGETAFAFRDREFLLQIQAWWNYPAGKEAAACRADRNWQLPYIDWVTQFRQHLADQHLVEGAFINFVDKDIPVNDGASTEEQRLELLRNYYGDKLDQLRQVKSLYDPDQVFEFPMSIPPAS